MNQQQIVRDSGGFILPGVVQDFQTYQPLGQSGHSLPDVHHFVCLAMPVFLCYERVLSAAETGLAVSVLRSEAIDLIDAFESAAITEAYSEYCVVRAKYLLCAWLDEVVMNSSWGQESVWPRASLLEHYFRETFSGERVFHLLAEAVRADHYQLPIVAMGYACLCLGFTGQYALEKEGRVALARLKLTLQHRLADVESSDAGEAIAISEKGHYQRHSLWVRFCQAPASWMAALAGCIMLSTYVALSWAI